MKILIALLGWMVWNLAILRIEKDKHDDNGTDFSLKGFAQKNWDNWLLSLLCVPLLLILGQNVLHVINMSDETALKWNDAYYAGSGFFVEALIFALKKWFAKKKAE